MEAPSGGHGTDGVVGQLGSDFHRDEAIGPLAVVKNRAQHGEGAGDVVDDQLPVGIGHRQPGAHQSSELFVVRGCALDGPGQNGRVGRHPPDAVADEATQRPVLEVGTAEIVEPGALAELSEEALQLRHWWPHRRLGRA